jgi:PAS domain S-box-containing protein
VDSSDDAIIFRDLDGVISGWNAAACRIFGYTAKEAIGRSIAMLIPADLGDEIAGILGRVRAGHRIDHHETRRVSKDGKTIAVSLTASPVMDADGRIIGATTIARDISGRKQADATLRESEERFRLAMNNVAEGLYTLDLEGVFTYVNPSAAAMFGWTSAELLGRRMHDVAHYRHPDGSPYPASECMALQEMVRGVELREREDVFIRKDGSFFPVIFSATPLRRDGETVGVVVGFRDDTLRRETARALIESEQRFRLVANAAQVMIWMTGVDKLCNYVNQGWLDFTGQPIETQLGHGWAESLHPQDVTGCLETSERAFNRREAFRMEYRLRRKDGVYRWVLDQGVPRFAEDGAFAGYIGSCIDVTELKLAEESLSTMSQRLIEAQEAERRRIARELHDDISQRLALQILHLQRFNASSSPADVLDGIAKIAQQTADLARDVRALSHSLHSANLEYLGLSAATSGFCKELCDQHHVTIDLRSEDVPADLSRDVSLCLFRTLQEALQNAIKHSGSRRFHVSLRGRAHEVELTVRDSGVGFEPEEAAKDGRLGLTSMRERLKLVNGKVTIDSQVGRGTTIHAKVPVVLKPQEAGV